MVNSLPVALTSFVGRDEELRDVEKLLHERRLVTLTGVGGSGKTRLAAQVCGRLVDDMPDGVWWVGLDSVSDPDLIPGLAASAMGLLVDPDGDPLNALASHLSQRRLLLCLDTCEHLLEMTAGLAEALLRSCPGVSVLATSREPLGVAGEAVWRVPPLKVDDAVRLFADRASLVSPVFALDAWYDDVLAVCRRVDGIPLAVELAAAWVRALTPTEIMAGLDRSFQLLAGGPRGALPRHQTLLASMDWSHERLDEVEKVLFRRLAVFVGGFTLDAVRAVCACDRLDAGDVLGVLGRLVDKSLVVVRQRGAETRYRQLDTVREYADERLHAAGDNRAVRDRHLDYFLALAERAEPELERDQDRWRQVLDSHRDNIFAAINLGLAAPEGHERGRRLCAAVATQWFIRGQTREGLDFLTRAIGVDPTDRSDLQARLHSGVAMLGMISGRRQLGADAAARGLSLATEDRTRARCLAMATWRAFFIDHDECNALCTQAYTLGEAAGEPFARDWGRTLAAYTMTTRDRHDEAVALARAAFAQAWPRRDRFCAGFARAVEVFAAMYTGDVRGAVTIGQEVLDIVTPLGDFFAAGTTTTGVAMARGMAGDIEGGRRLMATIVRSIDEAPDLDVVGFMVPLGLLSLWDGQLDDAVRWFERGANRPARDLDDWTSVRCLPGLTSALRRLARLDEAHERAAQAVAKAHAYNAPYMLSHALDEQGFLAAADDPARALDLHHEALAVRRASGLRTLYADSLDALACVSIRLERFAEAARLLAGSGVARTRMGYPRYPVDQPGIQLAVAEVRTALGDHEFDTVWAEGKTLSLDDAVTVASRGRGQRDRPATGWASLTPTEIEVVRLVVDGLTNPDIGRRMFVSRATVKTHLYHIYSKLNVANRTELAVLARDHLDR